MEKGFDEKGLGLNPFVADLTIMVRRHEKAVINKYDNPDVLERDYDQLKYCKVFHTTDARGRVVGLQLRSKELYLYLIHNVDATKDYIFIDKGAYMTSHGIKSINTFKQAVRDLSAHLYIHPHATLKNLYWINPQYFFNGSRLAKYPDRVRVINKPNINS